MRRHDCRGTRLERKFEIHDRKEGALKDRVGTIVVREMSVGSPNVIDEDVRGYEARESHTQPKHIDERVGLASTQVTKCRTEIVR